MKLPINLFYEQVRRVLKNEEKGFLWADAQQLSFECQADM